MNRILVLTQKRDDAIWIVDWKTIKYLNDINPNKYIFFSIKEKWTKRMEITINYIYNIFKLVILCLKYKKIYFSRQNPYVIFIKILYPRKKIYMKVHHIDKHWADNLIWKLVLKLPNYLIWISKFTQKQIIDFWINAKKVFLNYNWISEEFYTEKIDKFTDYPYILYVWSEHPRKNLWNLLKAFSNVIKKYPKLKLIKIGKESNKENLKQTDKFIMKYNLSKNIILKREYINNEDLRKFYSNAVCYVSVSKLEWFWLTVPEAMSCWCPVVVSDIWPFREIVWDSQILVDYNNVKKIEYSIIKYLSNKKFRESSAYKALKVRGRFIWGKNIEELDKILN